MDILIFLIYNESKSIIFSYVPIDMAYFGLTLTFNDVFYLISIVIDQCLMDMVEWSSVVSIQGVVMRSGINIL